MATGQPLRLWLVRHARPLAPPGLCYGASDLPADAGATADAARTLAAALPHGLPVWTSPLQRCEHLSQQLQWLRPDLALNCDERLAEMDFGCWEGMAWADIPRAALDAWTADFARHRFGGRESVAGFMARVAAALAHTRAQAAEGEAVWVSHAGVARAVQLLAQGVACPARADQWPAEAPGFGQWVQWVLPANPQ